MNAEKSCSPYHEPCRLPHGGRVDGVGHVERVPCQKWRIAGLVEDAIDVDLALCRVTGVEIGIGVADVLHPDVGGQKAVEPAAEARAVDRLRSGEVGDLPQGVDAGICPSPCDDLYPVIEDPFGCALQGLFHGDAVRLALPSVVVRSVVGQGEANVSREFGRVRHLAIIGAQRPLQWQSQDPRGAPPRS